MDAAGVTWLLPVLNGMPYVEETLASLGEQSARGARVLAWDNGSTDGTAEVLRAWIPARLPGRVVTGQPLPLGACLARLVEEAGTPLCARIDADDVALPNRLERQLAYMDGHPEVVACGTQMTMIDERGDDLGPYPERPLDDADLVMVSIVETPLSHPTVMFRRDAVLAVGNYRDRSPAEDLDLWLRLMSAGRLATLPERLVRYRMRGGSVTAQSKRAPAETQALITDLLAEHAEAVFGISGSDCRALRTQSVAFALPLLARVARHVGRRTGIPWTRALASEWFRSRWLPLLARTDYVARAGVRLLAWA